VEVEGKPWVVYIKNNGGWKTEISKFKEALKCFSWWFHRVQVWDIRKSN